MSNNQSNLELKLETSEALLLILNLELEDRERLEELSQVSNNLASLLQNVQQVLSKANSKFESD